MTGLVRYTVLCMPKARHLYFSIFFGKMELIQIQMKREEANDSRNRD